MKIHTQRGFAVLPIVLAIVVTAVIGLAGYKVFNDQQSDSVNKTETGAGSESAAKDTASNISGDKSTDELEQQKIDNTQSVTSPQNSFSLRVPGSWNYRKCSTYDGVVFIEYGGDGTQNCRQSDANFPEDGWYVFGRVVIGVGENGYPRPDDTVTTTVDLGNGVTAEKNSYTTSANKDKSSEIIVNEYVVTKGGRTFTAKMFSGDYIDGMHPDVDDKQTMQELEAALATLETK